MGLPGRSAFRPVTNALSTGMLCLPHCLSNKPRNKGLRGPPGSRLLDSEAPFKVGVLGALPRLSVQRGRLTSLPLGLDLAPAPGRAAQLAGEAAEHKESWPLCPLGLQKHQKASGRGRGEGSLSRTRHARGPCPPGAELGAGAHLGPTRADGAHRTSHPEDRLTAATEPSLPLLGGCTQLPQTLESRKAPILRVMSSLRPLSSPGRFATSRRLMGNF